MAEAVGDLDFASSVEPNPRVSIRSLLRFFAWRNRQ
jgi:hypothetical protein